MLFELPADIALTRNAYFPSRDGQRFLVNKQLGTMSPPITVVLNWQAALKADEGRAKPAH